MPLFDQLPPLPEAVSAEDALAAPPRKATRPLSRVPDRQRSIFEALASTRLKGSCGKFQSVVLDIRIKD
jgi:hypothetical protein